MSIPVATTTISVKRSADAGGWDPSQGEPPMTLLNKGVRAVISSESGRNVSTPGETSTVMFRLVCDKTALTYLDTVVDEITGEIYEVDWAHYQPGVAGLDHTQAGLKQVKGPGTN